MKTYEVIKEEYVPCTGNMVPDRREILELQLDNPAMYVQDLYKQERSVEFLAPSRKAGRSSKPTWRVGGSTGIFSAKFNTQAGRGRIFRALFCYVMPRRAIMTCKFRQSPVISARRVRPSPVSR